MKNKVFKMPNELIRNTHNFQPSTIGVAAIFYAYMNKHRKFTNSLKNIAALSHRCEDTVAQAITQLAEAGYLKRFQNFVYSEDIGKSIFAQTSYHVISPVIKDYTLVPYNWLNFDLTPGTFQTLLVCRMLMIKEESRSYPSIQKIVNLAGLVKSTVCIAIKTLSRLGVLIVEHCIKENGAHTCNSYHIVWKQRTAVQLLTETYSSIADMSNDLKSGATPSLFNSILPHIPLNLQDMDVV